MVIMCLGVSSGVASRGCLHVCGRCPCAASVGGCPICFYRYQNHIRIHHVVVYVWALYSVHKGIFVPVQSFSCGGVDIYVKRCGNIAPLVDGNDFTKLSRTLACNTI